MSDLQTLLDLGDLDDIDTHAKLQKRVDIELVVKSLKFYKTSKLAHKAYNERKNRLYHAALDAGLDKEVV